MSSPSNILHFYRYPGFCGPNQAKIQTSIKKQFPIVSSVETEFCFNVELESGKGGQTNAELSPPERETLMWLLRETFEPDMTREGNSYLDESKEKGGSNETKVSSNEHAYIFEVGPRLTFSTAYSSNAVSICHACGLNSIVRLERSRRYLLWCKEEMSPELKLSFLASIHDRMTEMVYGTPLESFESGSVANTTKIIPVLEEGRSAIEKINDELGLGFDDWDLNYYLEVFRDKLKRNPTDVELFDMGQSNSEHSRHWFFGGKMIIDNEEKEETLFKMVKSTLPKDQKTNSIIAFRDNSRAIEGFVVKTLKPQTPGNPSKMEEIELKLHPTFTAETHNFPTGIAPFPGAETGTGGRLRDNQGVGRGGGTVAGISSYCVGNLYIPGYEEKTPWEDSSFKYPSTMAPPLEIEIEASNGASDYGNKYGEPVVSGYTRSFGMRIANGERWEYIKPIMFSAGLGCLQARHAQKFDPQVGDVVVKIGGPAYRIGMGGGAASSRAGGSGDSELDFNAVQRGDAEMENKLNRVLRSMIECGDENPILSIHDQGAGGNGNVLKEIVEPIGALYDIRKIPCGDKTLSPLELWGAEYQENDCFLTKEEHMPMIRKMGRRENCPLEAVGKVTGNGNVTVLDSQNNDEVVVDLPLDLVLGDMPQKVFHSNTQERTLVPLEIPSNVTVSDALDRVLRLLGVGCKRFLTNKVDRSVTGLVAQQQCVGNLHIPLANCGVLAQTHFSQTGAAICSGEQPIKGLLSDGAGARMTVAETITNIMWANLTGLEDIKVAGNWMWAAKFEGEGAKMYATCQALRDILIELGVSIDGGKDSLSMAAKVGDETVKSPGTITIPAYCTVKDITKTVTPDIKTPDASSLIYVTLPGGQMRLGGTALAQCWNQLGDSCPDVENPLALAALFKVTQELIENEVLLSGHDRSDGGLATTLLEMAFTGNCGLEIDITTNTSAGKSPLEVLFNEEVGIVVEVPSAMAEEVCAKYNAAELEANIIGRPTSSKAVTMMVNGSEVLNDDMTVLRDTWEATSFELEMLQCNPDCVIQERDGLKNRKSPTWNLTYTPEWTSNELMNRDDKPKVCVLRQEGSNGDREMISAFHTAGFDVYDVHVNDLLAGDITLDQFRGIVFVGGFSYADTLDSAKGWAGVLKNNEAVWAQLQAFKARNDTFSLGICNGCQLMSLMGWVPYNNAIEEVSQPRFIENNSARFESRFVTVEIQNSPSIMLGNMAGSHMGVWVAHGEGRVHFPSEQSKDYVLGNNLGCVRYVNDDNEPTESYPFNPNGSPFGIAGLVSDDGRHLAMMPHPERCYLGWQQPMLPGEFRTNGMKKSVGPWLQMFQNARAWCDANSGN